MYTDILSALIAELKQSPASQDAEKMLMGQCCEQLEPA